MKAMKRMIKDEDPDIICLQEFIFPANFYIPWGYKKIRPSFHHEIYVKRKLKSSFKGYGIYYTHANIEGIEVYSVHGKWIDRVNSKLCKKIKKTSNLPSIAIGDFNMCAADMAKYDMGNPIRSQLGSEWKPTFEHLIDGVQDEIDLAYIWNLKPLSWKVIQDGYGAKRISDHYPIVCEIEKL